MPASSHALTDYPPTQLYLDTNMFLAHLVRTHPHHQAAADFLVHLATCGVTTLFISSLSWIEFTHVVTSQRWRDGLPAAIQQQYRLQRWHQAPIRQTYLQAMLAHFQALLASFAWDEIALTVDIRIAALKAVQAYDLDTHDAVHWASAQEAGVPNLASFDQDFGRITGLHLWTL